MFRFATTLLSLAALSASLSAQNAPVEPDARPSPSLAQRTAAMQHMPGLLPLDWDAKAGRLYLEVPLADAAHTRSAEYIYTDSLPFGTGSNDLGLDRGQVSEGRIVRFERTGPRLLLVEPNEAFRSSAKDPMEQLALTQSFPVSVLAGFRVEAEAPDGTVLVDATSFFLSDAHHVAEALAAAKQGKYRVDDARSTIALDRTRAFPKNTEVEAELTFTSDDASMARFVREVAPDARSLTVREHQSFLELPPPGFTPRRFSPRAGYFPAAYRDYNAPLGQPLDQQFIIRHRLIKRDPNCTHACVAVAPIHYYVDRGAPEPIRSALVEGARWWDQAFQAAGWGPGTFQVDVLPEGADPMDVRYNIIQWVHRYTRGWSYGEAITDPRTGEILKGNVTLGSLRGRQDYLIAEALLAPYSNLSSRPDLTSNLSSRPDRSANLSSRPERSANLSSRPERSAVERSQHLAAADATTNPMLAMVLQRIRQLAAHETGHTLGLAHNFAASSFPHSPDQTVSVMDYPHPYVTLGANGVPDLSHAYGVGIGIWDKVAIDYGYREFDDHSKPIEDPAALDAILTKSEKTGLQYITDEDARPFGSAHPHAHLWDNGTDPAAELNRVLEIRAAALKRFGENAIPPGTPMAQLEQTLVPLYLFHRYQTEAAIKEIGGLDYRYNVRGDGQIGPAIVPLAEQNAALTAVLKTLAPETLTLPEDILKLLPPVPPGYPRTQESLPSETGLTFDPVAAAEAAADSTLQILLDPARASRLLSYHMRTTADGTTKGPSLRVMMQKISATTAERPLVDGKEAGHTIAAEVERAVEFRGLEWMLSLAVNPAAASQARAIARYHIEDLLHTWTTTPPPTDSAESIHRTAMVDRINDFNRDPTKFIPTKPIEPPPGMPIGDDEE